MLKLQDICKTYKMGDTEVKALNKVSLSICQGEFVAIMGPSGSGKSTMLHVLGCLDKADSGAYFLDGTDVSGLTDDERAGIRNSKLGFVFQQFHLLSRLTALENVDLPLIYCRDEANPRDQAVAKIEAVGLVDRAHHRPNELSGGQQQRVAIARALVRDPLVIFADEPTGNLDTKSETEIMAILKALNREGKTIVMVTHEPEVAEFANRLIRMRDGDIVSDERRSKEPIQDKGQPVLGRNHGVLQSSQKLFSLGEIGDNFAQGFRSIISNKLRSFLSMLGILIGVASVIAMLALGQGAKDAIKERLSSLGTNVLTITPGSHRMNEISLEAGAVTRFTLKDVEAIAAVERVKRISPLVAGRVQMVSGSENWNTQVMGVGVNFPEMKAMVPTLGRFFTEEEVQRREKVVLLGLSVVKELFGDRNPVGEVIKINRVGFEVIGILPEKGSSPHGDRDDVAIIPITTAMFRILGKDYVDSIDAEVDALENMDMVKGQIGELILQRHRLKEDDREAFSIQNMAEIQKAMQGMTQTLTLLLGFIAVISLLVGGIGIMNIMLVSVTERTREIGLRNAVGARRKDILLQFLTESVVMTVSGGIMGIVFGSSVAWLLAAVAGWAIRVSVSSVLLATAFSVLVGLCFGIWPARKAAALNPIDALRYE